MDIITKLVKIDKNIDYVVAEAAQFIKDGEIVAFPTETVYGLGADGLNPKAIKKIFDAKGRPQDNPLILHISSLSMLKELTRDNLERAMPLIERFWPGPLTMVFNRSQLVPDEITGGLDTVAIRMPANGIALKLINVANRPIAAPSANISGRPSPTDAETCYFDLQGKVPMILDGGPTEVGLESTVLDLTSKIPTILRPGAITLEMLEEVLGVVDQDASLIKDGETPKSPGQKYKHYAPVATSYLIRGTDRKMACAIREFILNNPDKKIGLMISKELATKLVDLKEVIKSPGSRMNPEEIGSSIFRILREFDKDEYDIIIVEFLDEKNIGAAIMNRLKKACSNKYLGE